MTKPRGFSLLEFAVVVIIIAGIVYALLPRVSDSLKLAHETVLKQTAAAFRDSLKLVEIKHRAMLSNQPVFDFAGAGSGQLDLNSKGFPIGIDWQPGEQRALHARDCEALWHGLLGGFPPSASISGDSDFRVQTGFDPQHGLGCHYRYLRAGELSIRYFPDDGSLLADVRF